MGKSRLLGECRERFAAAFGAPSCGAWLEGAAVSYGSAVPYLPYRNLLLTWLGLPLDASVAAVRSTIDLRAAEWPPAVGSALAELEPLVAGAADFQPAEPQATQAIVFRAVTALVGALASTGPVALAFEDLHWSDATSLALTESLAPICAESPVLLLATLRAEPGVEAFEDRIADASSRALRLRLAPLARETDRELLRALVGSHVLPRRLEERLLDTTDGNPFFIEEQVRTLVDEGALVPDEAGWRYVGDRAVELAPTLERALMARIDRLSGAQRDTLVAAAVLGSPFDASVLSELTGTDPRAPLVALEQTDLVHREGSNGAGETYRFRHALVQEAAYRSLLRRHRRELHAKAAIAIETQYAGRTDEVAVSLGRHLAEAGEAQRAVGYLAIGARRATAAFANEEAAALCKQALELLAPQAGALAAADRARAIELLRMRVAALHFLAAYDEAAAAIHAAIQLTPFAEPLSRARLHVTGASVEVDAHRYQSALDELVAAEACIGDRTADDEGFAVWLDVQLGRGTVFYWRGDAVAYSDMLESVEPHVRARATLAQRIHFYEAVRSQLWRRDRYVISDELLRLDRSLYEAQRESDDPETRAWAPFLHGFTLLWHRDLTEAEPLLREALARADELEDALLRSRALTYLMVAARLRGQVEPAEELIEPVREAAREASLPEYAATADATAAWAAWRRANRTEAVSVGRKAMETWERLPNRYFFDWMACLPLVAACLEGGEVEAAAGWATPMLADTQQPLPDEVAAELRAGVATAGFGNEAETDRRLSKAVETAKALGYL